MKDARATMPLSPHGTARQVLDASSAYPQGLQDLLRDTDLEEGGAYLAWQFAQLADFTNPLDQEALMLLVGRLLAAHALGSTCLAVNEDDRELLAKLPDLVGCPGESTPLVLDGAHVYAGWAYACESRIIATLGERAAQAGPFSPAKITSALADVMASGAGTPSEEQRAAIEAVLGHAIGIISGGPGTGKTTTVLALVRTLVRLGVAPHRIALSAPTGKAASRLEDDFRTRLEAHANLPPVDRRLLADCPKAQTLHRLIGDASTRRRPVHDRRNPLPYRVVIVDESSMIDLRLMDRLLSALTQGTLLVLLGDADQLPSVSAGAVFRDLGELAVRLRRGFRTSGSGPAGEELAALGQAIRKGEVAACLDICRERTTVSGLTHQGAERLSPEQREPLLRAHHAERFTGTDYRALAHHVYTLRAEGFGPTDTDHLDALAAHLAGGRILTVTRQRTTGVEATNAFLHELRGGGPDLLPGEPVMMLRNDYERGLWNGDQGVAVRVDGPSQRRQLGVAFRTREGWQAVDPRPLGDALALAYALTVHKSQGSEWEEVLLLLPDGPSPLLTRELLYTAVSRARRSLILCGDALLFETGLREKQVRSSGIAQGLAARSIAPE